MHYMNIAKHRCMHALFIYERKLKSICTLLPTIYNSLTPKLITIEPLDLGTFELIVFGLMASIEKAAMGLLKVVLSFHR